MSIRLDDICLSIFRFGFIRTAFPLQHGIIMCVIRAFHKGVDVVFLSVLLCMHHWLYVSPCCQSSYVVNWPVYEDGEEEG
jgi:hypothetical protein